MRFLFPIAALIFCFGCQSSINDEQLVGQWTVTEVTDSLLGYLPDEKGPILEWAETLQWDLGADHQYLEQDAIDTLGHGGEWSFSPEKSLLSLRAEGMEDLPTKDYLVESGEEGQLTFVLSFPNSGRLYLRVAPK